MADEFLVNEHSSFYSISFFSIKTARLLDQDIARLLDISYDEYILLAEKFQTKHVPSGAKFYNYSDAQHFADYLNDKYLVMLKLSNKI